MIGNSPQAGSPFVGENAGSDASTIEAGMSSKCLPFTLEGEFICVAEFRHGVPRRIAILNSGSEVVLKLAKPLRSVFPVLKPGTALQLRGYAEMKKGRVKRKVTAFEAEGILGEESGSPSKRAGATGTNDFRSHSKIVIQICGKKNCWNKGGAEVYDQLQKRIEQEGHTDIRLEKTGCLGNCRNCPSACLPASGEIFGKIYKNLDRLLPSVEAESI